MKKKINVAFFLFVIKLNNSLRILTWNYYWRVLHLFMLIKIKRTKIKFMFLVSGWKFLKTISSDKKMDLNAAKVLSSRKVILSAVIFVSTYLNVTTSS